MTSDEKILKVLEHIKGKTDIAPRGSTVDYRAGNEVYDLNSEDEILILNKLEEENIIEVVDNFASEYI